MKNLVAGILLLFSVQLWANEIVYSDSMEKHYPVQGKAFDMGSYERETPRVVWNASQTRSATVIRTRGDTYPYERQKGLIMIEGDGLEKPRVLSVSHFRTIDVSWVTEKLILIRIGVGRVAAVEAIYDVVEETWVYRESLQYIEDRG